MHGGQSAFPAEEEEEGFVKEGNLIDDIFLFYARKIYLIISHISSSSISKNALDDAIEADEEDA